MIRSNTPQPSLDFDRQLSPRLGKLAFFNLKKVLIACFFSVISACYEGWEDRARFDLFPMGLLRLDPPTPHSMLI